MKTDEIAKLYEAHLILQKFNYLDTSNQVFLNAVREATDYLKLAIKEIEFEHFRSS